LPTFQRNLTIGSTPVLAIVANSKRDGWRVSMYSTTLVAANTGFVFVGRNIVPVTTVGDPNSGDVLFQGTQLVESKAYETDEVFGGDIWLVASAAGQIVSVEEEF